MQLFPVTDVPLISPGDCLAEVILTSLDRMGAALQEGDVLAVAQKIVSKAEGRYARLADVTPGDVARSIAEQTGKDPRLVELILSQSQGIVRMRKNVLIMRHRLGYVMAQAGIDRSNIPEGDDGQEQVLLLPEAPDASARRLRAAIGARSGVYPHVIITDSWGRPWRKGVVGFAIGCAGFAPLISRIGEPDLYGRTLEVTEIAVADQLAAAASFLMGEGREASPVIVIRDACLSPAQQDAKSLLRPAEDDLFR